MTTFEEAYKQMDKQDLTMEKEHKHIKIRTIEIAGMASVLQALRLPFGLECRSRANAEYYKGDTEPYRFATVSLVELEPKDLHLLSTLVKRGPEHAKCIRGIVVYAEIDAPRYWWQEADTYRIGTERLASASTMHIQGKRLSTEELVRMKENLTEGTMQKRIQMFSYQTLRRIYFQRRNHRLPIWREFCQWIESLPFSNELIIIENDNKRD